MTRYTTRQDAIDAEVLAPLWECAAEHDVDAIADEVLQGYAEGYALRPEYTDSDSFWAVVERHANT